MSTVQDQMNSAVETAREAAAKVGESVTELFQGNPFNTTVGKKIEQATDATTLATENWGLNMEIVDFIIHTEEGGREAIRAIRKRLHTQMSKNNSIVMYTLTVLETCVKNGDHRFHVLVCNKDFVLDLVKLIGPKFDAPQIIQERVLSLIQAWADAFRSDPELVGVVQVYEDLKAKGVEFPATDLDCLAPIITPKRTVFSAPSSRPPPSEVVDVSHNPSEIVAVTDRTMPIDPDNEQLSKLRGDIDVVNSNLKVLREMLTEITAGGETPEELELINELHSTTKSMQQRVLDLIRVISNEQVTFELLVVNDEFNSVFEKYDRWMANRTGEGAAKTTTGGGEDLINLGGGEEAASLEKQLSALKVAQANDQSPSSENAYAANAEQQAALGLAAATAQRTQEAPPATEAEAAEMAAWIQAHGEGQQAPKPTKKDDENEKL